MESELCPQCGQYHPPIATYKKWIKQYKDNPGKGVKAQVERWTRVVESHKKKRA